MAIIVTTPETKEKRKPKKAHEVKQAPKPKTTKTPPKTNVKTKLINGIPHIYCIGSYGWWPQDTFNQSQVYSDSFLKSKGLFKETPKPKSKE